LKKLICNKCSINDLAGSISVQGIVLRTTGNPDAFKFNNCKYPHYKVVIDKAKKGFAQMLRMFKGARGHVFWR